MKISHKRMAQYLNMPFSGLGKPETENYPLLLPDAIYWPFERLPESKLEAYAAACVEIALKYSEDAQTIYAGIVRSWELPGCQLLIDDFVQHKQDTRTWLCDRGEAVVRNQALPEWPDGWKHVIAKARDNTDFHKLLKYVTYFILIAFNRKVDLDNQTPKVSPGKSPYLAQAMVSRSLLGYLAEKPEMRGPGVMPDDELDELYWFSGLLAGAPTVRKEREAKHTIVQALRHEGFTLRHNTKLLDDAEKWYKSRVDPGTIEAYLNELPKEGKYGDRGRIENDIAPCDEATGYPRNWRK